MKNKLDILNVSLFFCKFAIDLQGIWLKMNAMSTITKSLPIVFMNLVNYSQLAVFGFANFFYIKKVDFYDFNGKCNDT